MSPAQKYMMYKKRIFIAALLARRYSTGFSNSPSKTPSLAHTAGLFYCSQGESFHSMAGKKSMSTRIVQEAKTHSITPATQKILDASAQIRLDSATRDNAVFQHVVMCNLNMPRSRTDARIFERVYERPGFRCSLSVEAGRLFTGERFEEQPLPYGIKPRLIFIHLVTSAIKTNSPEVPVAATLRQFMLQLGIAPQGSEYKSFRKQMMSLAASKFVLGMKYPDGRIVNLNSTPIESIEAWVSPDSSDKTPWPGIMTLSKSFFESLKGCLVPMDERAVSALDGSLELDIYFWLAQRLHRISDGQGQFVTWLALREQFAPDYSTVSSFKQQFLRALRQVHRVYPDAELNYLRDDRGIWLYASRPPIPYLL